MVGSSRFRTKTIVRMQTLLQLPSKRYRYVSSILWGMLLGLNTLLTATGQTCQIPIGGRVIPIEDFGSNHSLYPLITPTNSRFLTSYNLLDYTATSTSPGQYVIVHNPRQLSSDWSVGDGLVDGDCMLIDALSVTNQIGFGFDPNGDNSFWQTKGWDKQVQLEPNEQYVVKFKFKNAFYQQTANTLNPYPLVSLDYVKLPMTNPPYSEANGFPASYSWTTVSYAFTTPSTGSLDHHINIWAKTEVQVNAYGPPGPLPPTRGNDCMIDDIEIIRVGLPGPGDVVRTVCGFGERQIVGPGNAAYNWYAADGVTLLSQYPQQTLTANLTQRHTEFRVTTTNPYSGCESQQSTVSVNVEGVLVFNDNFNDTQDNTGYPQGYLSPGYVVDRSKMNFTTSYEPVIVRYVTGWGNNCNSGRSRPGQYPCYPGDAGSGHLTVAYDPYSYNDYWLRWPEEVTTPLNPNPGYYAYNNYPAQTNRFLIVDSKTSNSARDELWTRKIPVRAGFTYEIRLKMMNAEVPGSSPDPFTPVVSLGNGLDAQLVDRGQNYSPISSFTIAKQTTPTWTQVTYLVTAPTTIPTDGKLPLSLYTIGVPNDSGRDFLLDDIEVYELSSMTTPQVANAAQCDPGPVTLSVIGASNASQSDYQWFADGDLTQLVGRGPSVTVNTVNRGYTYFYVQNRLVPSCPSLVKAVLVNVHNTRADFTVTPQPGTGVPIAPDYAIQFTAALGSATTSYTWDWGDKTPPETKAVNTAEHKFATAGTYAVRLTVTELFPKNSFPDYLTTDVTCTKTSVVTLNVFAPLCALTIPLGGHFTKDKRTGATTYLLDGVLGACVPPVAFECVGETGQTQLGVVAASATAFADSLVHTDLSYAPASANPFLGGQGRMRPYASYSYRAPITTNMPNYQAGTFTAGYFNWQSSARARPSVWLAPSIATNVSPDGIVLQERDALGVRSTVKYGYGRSVSAPHALLYLQAQNADYGSVLFEGFETADTNGGTSALIGEDAWTLKATEVTIDQMVGSVPAHTGTKVARLLLSSNQGQLTLKPLAVTTQLQQVGLSIRLWVHSEGLTMTQTVSKVSLESLANPGTTSAESPLLLLAQVGEWSLYEAVIASPTTLTVGEMLLPHIQLGGDVTVGTPAILVDDIRLQPRDAQMTAYVYDPSTLRLLASFDDQHFALLYQYNTEGKLIRKQVETERGVKTLQETFYHTPQIAHP
jgi:hypothetical protein